MTHRRPRSMSTLIRPVAQALASVLALGVLAFTAAPAGAVVVEIEKGAVKVGVQPRNISLFDGSWGYDSLEKRFNNLGAFQFANPTGAPVLPATHIYAIYWDPTDHYHSDWQGLIDTFFEQMGAASGSFASVFAIDSQYTDRTNQHASYAATFMGPSHDTSPYPKATCTDPQPLEEESLPGFEPDAITCLTDAQIQTQLKTFIAGHSLPKGMSTIFYLLTPPGVTVCLDKGGPKGHCSDYEATVESYENSFCSYHSDISPTSPLSGDANTILYGVIPWTAGGLADGHLGGKDQTPASDCQDGGFNPTSKPFIEEREKQAEKTKKQEEEEAKSEKTKKEKEAQERQEFLEGPHQEEPNQPVGNGPDGFPDTGLADLIISQIGVQQQNIVTNPLLNAWQDPNGMESTDECRNFFVGQMGGSVAANEQTGAGTLFNQTYSGGNYYINDAFNLAALELPYPGVPCQGGLDLAPHFTVPNPVNSGEIVGFNGMESDISLNWGNEYPNKGLPVPTYAVYKWDFGDGSPEVTGYAPGTPPSDPPSALCEEPWRAPCAGSTFHSYQYGGTYQVTLTVTDTGGNTASITHPITVDGPAPPAPEPPPSPGPPSGPGGVTPGVVPPSPGSGSGSGSGSAVQSPPLPGPVATAAAVATSLKRVSRSGLVVRYKVNEQVAGRFEVLLDAATAHSLGITGEVATELPAGSPRSLVIGRALLVTTKGGRSSVRIKFSKRVAKHLRRARKVTLMLRLKVRNAAKSPLFTTVISTVDLHR